MHHRALHTTAVAAAIALVTAAAPPPAGAAVPKACSLLSIGALQKLFPGSTVTPPQPAGDYDCSWATDVTGQSENRISISIRPNLYGRWEQMQRESRAASGSSVPGLGAPAIYSIVDGIHFLKSGYVVQVSLIGTGGAAAAEPKETEIARAVIAKFSE